MSQEDREYLNQVEKHLGYFGVYPPNRLVRLGDYGKRQGDEFEGLGNIAKWIEPKPERRARGHMVWMSEGDVDTKVAFGAADKTGQHQVDVTLNFKKKWSIVFIAQGVSIVETANMDRVGERILKEYHEKGNDWQLAHEFVSELVTARTLLVMVARESGAQARLSGRLPVQYQGLPIGDLDLRQLKASGESSSVGIWPVTDATPLFKLCKVKDTAFKKAEITEVR